MKKSETKTALAITRPCRSCLVIRPLLLPRGVAFDPAQVSIPSLAPNARGYLLPRAVALLIRVAALLASASFSRPNTAEYLRPTTCAITKLMLIPVSPTALAIAWPSPGRLSPSTSRVEMDEGGETRGLRRRYSLLTGDRIQLD